MTRNKVLKAALKTRQRRRDVSQDETPSPTQSVAEPAPLNSKIRHLVDQADSRPLGATSPDELRAVFDANFSAESDLSESDVVRICKAVMDCLRKRSKSAASKDDSTSPCVFVLLERPRETGLRLGAEREPIIDDGSQPLNGKLWLISSTAQSGYQIDIAGKSNKEIFQRATELDLDRQPTFWFDPKAVDKELRYYPAGLQETDDVFKFPIAEHEFSLAKLDETLTRFYENHLRTPDAKKKKYRSWANAKKYFPVDKAEEHFHELTNIILSAVFTEPIRIDSEGPSNVGRFDLRITSVSPSDKNSFFAHAILELKVLRSYTPSGTSVPESDTTAAITKGVQQTIAYVNKYGGVGLLCCYDMRSKDKCNKNKCFDHILKLAGTHKVELRRYRLYGSSEDWRADEYKLV